MLKQKGLKHQKSGRQLIDIAVAEYHQEPHDLMNCLCMLYEEEPVPIVKTITDTVELHRIREQYERRYKQAWIYNVEGTCFDSDEARAMRAVQDRERMTDEYDETTSETISEATKYITELESVKAKYGRLWFRRVEGTHLDSDEAEIMREVDIMREEEMELKLYKKEQKRDREQAQREELLDNILLSLTEQNCTEKLSDMTFEQLIAIINHSKYKPGYEFIFAGLTNEQLDAFREWEYDEENAWDDMGMRMGAEISMEQARISMYEKNVKKGIYVKTAI